MDWKHILSVSIDNISEEEKEELYNAIAWFNYDSEKLDSKKYIALLKISQEIMKYKTEQVEALLAELDEIAVQQGEEEARKHDSLESLKNLNSKKSTQYEGQKYKEIKMKLRQQIKSNENQEKKIENLQQQLVILSEQKSHLQSELSSALEQANESSSELSETHVDRQKELVQMVQDKNKQISQLLTDIENTEVENLELKKTVANLHGNLEEATHHITTNENEYTAMKIKFDDSTALSQKLKEINEALRSQVEDLVEAKKVRDEEIDQFTAAIDGKVNEWQKILHEKDNEIEKMRNQIHISGIHSSSDSNLSSQSDNEVFSKLLTDREAQIVELQKQLHSATVEMDKSTQVIQQLTLDKSSGLQKIDELHGIVKNLKAQVQVAHERCQNFHESLTAAENLTESKQKDIDQILSQLKRDGNADLAEVLEHNQDLKSRIRLQEKKLSSYVTIANKLQNSVDTLGQENRALREKCNIASDEEVDLNGVLLKKSKERIDLKKCQKQILALENEKLELRSQIHNLNRQLSNISTTNVKDNSTEVEVYKDTTDSQKKEDEIHTKYITVLQENDALRKGLHEVLESVQLKSQNSKKEIKSETLEKLLRALDMRHVSGWYHPAMRLQAELHTLQGANTELRDQLKELRCQLNEYGEGSKGKMMESLQKNVDEREKRYSIKDRFSKSQVKVTLDNQENENTINNLTKKLEDYSHSYQVIQEQLKVLYDQYMLEKSNWESKKADYECGINRLEEKSAVLEAKLQEFLNFDNEKYRTADRFASLSEQIVVLNRKCVFLENRESNLTLEVNRLTSDLKCAEIASYEKISELRNNVNILKNELKIKNQINLALVNRDTFIELRNNFDSVMLKYRQLLNNFNSIRTEYSSEVVVLTESLKSLEEQNQELRNTLEKALANRYREETLSASAEIETLSNKIAHFEINEITEKQRANHMNNLYNVVKDQLEKAEKRSESLEKQNQELLNKNLMLQEDITKFENKLLDCIDTSELHDLKFKYEKVSKENDKLLLEINQLQSDIKLTKKKQMQTSEISNSLEVLNLKHQILDLQSTSDDKALIARLSSDVVIARLSENQYKKQLDELETELKECQDYCETLSLRLSEEQASKFKIKEELFKKIGVLDQAVRENRERFLGSAPLISQEIYNTNLQQVLINKMESFKSFITIKKTQNNCLILEEEMNKKLFLLKNIEQNEDVSQEIREWYRDKITYLMKNLKNERELELANLQIKQIHSKLNTQDELIAKLHEELLKSYNLTDKSPSFEKDILKISSTTQTESTKTSVINHLEKSVTYKETQTDNSIKFDHISSAEKYESLLVTNLKLNLNKCNEELREKDNRLDQLKMKITELEMNVSLFKSQIGDKQSQIMFYEKHILELQNKVSKLSDDSLISVQNKVLLQPNSEETVALNNSLKKLKEECVQKDDVLLKYQTLLKKDRDEHSLAASRMQQEMQRLQEVISTQKKTYTELKESSIQHPGKAAIEQYILQVHALEKHTTELHTTVSTLNSQLQCSRQETSRWQMLANERLDSIEQLREDLETQHRNELAVYKKESETWCNEIVKLKELISHRRSEIVNHNTTDIHLQLKEKDDLIHDLNVSLKQVKKELKKCIEKSDTVISPKLDELEEAKEQNTKDNELWKKRYEQVLNRERSLKEELHTLKEQLLKKPISARGDKSEKELHLQKKVEVLEKENENLKTKLDRQLVINESHRIAVTEDFEKWKKQKYWQQTAEKLKNKLHEKEEEFNKLSQSCAGYKGLIERLEKDKYGLENRIKNLRGTQLSTDIKRFEVLTLENEELRHRIDLVNAKLEMQQHHSGGLGAAMLQEKLEAQERKIAILELSSKGSVEVRAEVERLHSSMENIQKLNLRLEAENLELKLDLEKYKKDVPRLREQIEHLENYVKILKSESESKDSGILLDDKVKNKQENKKVTELERTVFVLKRVVEKLQVENKRLVGSSRLCSTTDRGASDKSRSDVNHLKEQLDNSIQQVVHLEDQLKAANSKIVILEAQSKASNVKIISDELANVKDELAYKAQLLDKVKILLHRAAIKEKSLVKEVDQLKAEISSKI